MFFKKGKIYLLILETEQAWEPYVRRDRRRESSDRLPADLGLDLTIHEVLPEMKPILGCLTKWATRHPKCLHIYTKTWGEGKGILKWKEDDAKEYWATELTERDEGKNVDEQWV